MTTEQALWQRRWQALDHTLELLEERYESFTLEDSSRRENTLFTLLIQLRKFAEGQFHFFHDGFYTKRFVDLAPIPDQRDFALPQYITGHPIEAHVLHNTLHQIAEDIVVIQRASEQRMIAEIGAAQPVPRGNIITPLVNADKVALNALRMVEDYLKAPQETAFGNQKQTVLTYFRRSANVRVIPYAPVAMIGIPITAVGIDQGIGVIEDLLAIPHEMAHHLYWNGWADSGQRIYAALASHVIDNPVSHWLEEIFADVVGCLIAGPAAARSFIELQLTEIAAEFHHTDDPHPTPALRPLIYAYTLEQMGATVSAAAIREVWQSQLEQRMAFVNRELLFASYQIVDAVLSIIDQNRMSSWLRWSEDGAYDELYANFAERIPSLMSGVRDEDLDPDDLNIQSGWHERVVELAGQPELSALPERWARATGAEEGAESNAIAVAAAAWLSVYDAGGWITAGPQGGNGSIH